MKKSITFEIETSEQFGTNFCSHDCAHIEQFTKFPLQLICKATGASIEVMGEEGVKRYRRTDACKYLFAEEGVPERFWSPLKGT